MANVHGLNPSWNCSKHLVWRKPLDGAFLLNRYRDKNVLGLVAVFKFYVGLWFFQGAFLSGPAKVLVNVQEGKTKALRQWRFTDISVIDLFLVKEYVL